MKRPTLIKGLALMAASCLLATGCVVRERAVYANPPAASSGEVDVSSAPPAPLDDTITVAPDPAFVWIGGVWVWGGGGWRWEAGHWARPPHPGMHWVPHRYAYRNGRHVWVRGGWR